MMTYVDPLLGTRFLQSARSRCVAAGVREQAAWCDFIFAYYAMFMSTRRGHPRLADRYTKSARRFLEGLPVPDRLLPLELFLKGLVAEREMRWAVAGAYYDQAIALAEKHLYGTLEHCLAIMNKAQVDFFGEDLAGLEATLGRMRALSRSSPQSVLPTYTAIMESALLFARGRFEESKAMYEELIATLFRGPPNRLGWACKLFGHSRGVYLDDPRTARREFAADFEAARRFGALRYMRAGAIAALGAILEANALRVGDPSATVSRVRELARFAHRAPPYMAGGAWRALAYAADARGAPREALRLLARAEREALACAQPMQAEVARYQRGLRIGGEEGRALVLAARRAAREGGTAELMLEEDAGLRG
jgi:tetratricopeptide (TPR) repeat protein